MQLVLHAPIGRSAPSDRLVEVLQRSLEATADMGGQSGGGLGSTVEVIGRRTSGPSDWVEVWC